MASIIRQDGGVERWRGAHGGSASGGAEYPYKHCETRQSAVCGDAGTVSARGASGGWAFRSRRIVAARPVVEEWHNEGLGAASADQGGMIAVYAAGLQEVSEKNTKVEEHFSDGGT